MSSTAITSARTKFRKHRKQLDSKTDADLASAGLKRPTQYITVSVSDGGVSMLDYSHGEETEIVRTLIGSMGVNEAVRVDSICG